MRKIFFFLCFIYILPLFSRAQDNAQKTEVMMKMLNLKNALLSKDSVSLSALLSDDVTYGHSNGIIQTKAELIRSVVSGEQDYKVIEPSDMNVRIYDNTGVVTMKLKADLIYGGKPLNLNMNATLTWVKIDGEWKLVARQSVKLAE
jgi:hypothetical protein